MIDEIRDIMEAATRESGAPGGQVWVASGDRVLCDLAVGDSIGASDFVPMTRDDLHNTYCLTKPCLALAFCLAAEAGFVSLDVPLVDQAPWLRGHLGESCTAVDVLAHNAGLRFPTAAQWRLMPSSARQLPDWDAEGPRPVYSEFAGWYVLEQVLDRHVEGPCIAWLEDVVLKPLGLIDEIVVDPDRARRAEARARIRVPVGGYPERPFPLLSEVLEVHLLELRPAFGALTSAAGVGRFYQALWRTLQGRATDGFISTEALEHLLTLDRGLTYDKQLRRPANFAGGFMVDMAHGGCGMRPDVTTFGHTSGMGNGVAFCDPVADLVVSLYMNGMSMDAAVGETARSSVVTAIYEVIDR